MAAGGDGVGRIGELACFVPRTAPGDRVQVAYVQHARHARGRVLQVLEPSADRVAPLCGHYERDRCGGCQLQHLSEQAQQHARVDGVRETLRRIGGRTVETPSLVTGAQWGYRGRLTLTLHKHGRSWVGGLHPHDDPSRVFALEECPISHPALVAVWQVVRRVIVRSGDPAVGALPVAQSLRLSLRLDAGIAEGSDSPSVAVILHGGTTWDQAARWAATVLQEAPAVNAVWWQADAQAAVPLAIRRAVAGMNAGDASVAGDDAMAFDLTDGGDSAVPSAQEVLAFAQVNADVADALRRFVHEQVMHFAPTAVVDAYAGAGLLSAELARDGVQVVAIEADPAGAAAARRRFEALEGGSARRHRVICALVEDALPDALPASVVVLNPPRRGVDARVAATLERAVQSVGAAQGLRGLVYVSCDPATLARDLSRLPGWQITALQCFDMFPQTSHVETVCVLQPQGR